MSAVLPAVAPAVLSLLVLLSAVRIARGRPHPRRLAAQLLGAGTLLGVLGLSGTLGQGGWPIPWILALALLGATTCTVLRRPAPPAADTARGDGARKGRTRPSLIGVAAELLVFLAVAAVALVAG